MEGLELAATEARAVIKQQKEAPKMQQQGGQQQGGQSSEAEAFRRMTALHQHWVQHRGWPKNQAEWKGWFDYLKQQGHDDASINKFYKYLQSQAQNQPQRGR